MVNDPNRELLQEETALFQKNVIRRRFLESVKWVLLSLLLIGLPISLSRIPKTGLHPNHILHSCVGVLVLIVFFARKRLSDVWLNIGVLFTFSILSVSAFLQYGLVSAGFYFTAAAVFVSTVSLGLRCGLICTALHGTFILFVAYLWISGYLVFPLDVGDYIMLPIVWATLGISFLITTAVFIISASGFVKGLTELIDTIDRQKRKIEERTSELAQANKELEEALQNIKTLSGLLPICSNCKKIRDDKGYWQQVEKYVQHHSKVQFTHGLCPDCIRELYPDIAGNILEALGEDGDQ